MTTLFAELDKLRRNICHDCKRELAAGSSSAPTLKTSEHFDCAQFYVWPVLASYFQRTSSFATSQSITQPMPQTTPISSPEISQYWQLRRIPALNKLQFLRQCLPSRIPSLPNVQLCTLKSNVFLTSTWHTSLLMNLLLSV